MAAEISVSENKMGAENSHWVRPSHEQYAQANKICIDGIREYQSGNRQEAIQLWHQALEIYPNFASVLMNLGAAHRDLSRFDLAIKYFQDALNADPELAEAHFNLALSLHLLNLCVEAVPYYLRAIHCRPDFALAHNNLDVLLYENIKDPEQSILCYSRMRQDNPYIDQVGPRRIRIETSSACNLRCQHCPTGTNYGGTGRGVMSMELFEQILCQMKKMPILQEAVLYLGGEPLLNRNIALMCRRVKEETGVIRTQFNTNAMLVNERICRELSEAAVDKINVSIDGRSPEENDRMRQGAHYETIVKNVKMLRDSLGETQIGIVNTIFRRPGEPEEPVVPEFLRRDFSGLPISTNYALKWPELEISRSAFSQLTVLPAAKKADNFCKMPFTQLAVRPNGDVTLCCYDLLGSKIMGNVQKEELMDIWQHEEYQRIRNSILERDVGRLPKVCQGCLQYQGGVLIDPQ